MLDLLKENGVTILVGLAVIYYVALWGWPKAKAWLAKRSSGGVLTAEETLTPIDAYRLLSQSVSPAGRKTLHDAIWPELDPLSGEELPE